MVIKVMHIIRPADGGMQEHLITLLQNMDSDQFENVVVCPKNSSIALRMKALKKPCFEVNLAGDLKPTQDIRTIFQIRKLILEFRPNIVHTHGAKAGLLGRLANFFTNNPINIATVHNFVLENKVPDWKKTIYKNLETILAKRTHNYITVSEALKGHIMEHYKISPTKISTIYNGINVNSFTANSMEISEDLSYFKRNNIPLVGVVARLAPQKGVSYFIQAAKLVCSVYPKAQFIIVGEGPEKENLETLRSCLGLDKHIVFLGERKDVGTILKNLDVYVLPSISEGLSISTIEAIAAGCPVVATDVGGVPEIIKNYINGILIEPANPTQMADAILELLHNKNLAMRLSKEGLDYARQKFDLEIMIQKTQNLYKKLSLPS